MIWAFFGQNIFFDFLGFLRGPDPTIGLEAHPTFFGQFFFLRQFDDVTGVKIRN